MSESTYHEAMNRFCEDVIAVFGKYYMREPNKDDTALLLSINESRVSRDAGQYLALLLWHGRIK
jgi:hypothetical protein